MPKQKELPKYHMTCTNNHCGSSIRAPGYGHVCPYCGGRMERHWANHLYIEDTAPGVVTEVMSLDVVVGKFCTYHKEWE